MTKIILGLAGEIASGKGTVAQYLVDKYQAKAYGFSSALRDVAKRMHLEENRENLQKLSTIFRENFHDDILSEVIYEDVKKSDCEIIAIDGVRRMPDISFLQKLEGFKLVYLEATMENRFERIVNRRQNADDASKTFEEFKKDHEREAELQIRDLKAKSDIVVENNGDFEELYRQIDELISENNK